MIMWWAFSLFALVLICLFYPPLAHSLFTIVVGVFAMAFYIIVLLLVLGLIVGCLVFLLPFLALLLLSGV